jgi:hypothetical protein
MRCREEYDIEIADPSHCWVKRDPNKTREMIDACLRNISASNDATEAADAARGNGLLSSTPLLPYPVARAVRGGSNAGDDPEWRLLRNLPSSYPVNAVSGPTHELDSSGKRPCFICRLPVTPHAEQAHWTEVPINFYCGQSSNKTSRTATAMKHLRNHCE